MFKFIFKKGIKNLIIKYQNELIYIYEKELYNCMQKLQEYDIMIKNDVIDETPNTIVNKANLSENFIISSDVSYCFDDLNYVSEATMRRRKAYENYKKHKATKAEFIFVKKEKLFEQAKQKYLTEVFNSVCNNVSAHSHEFESKLPFALITFKMPDSLCATTIYLFAYFVQFGELISSLRSKECNEISLNARKLMENCQIKYANEISKICNLFYDSERYY